MDKLTFALSLLGIAIAIMVLGSKIKTGKSLVFTIGFFMLVTGGFASYANWLPQTRGEVPAAVDTSSINVDTLSTDKLADMGAKIIFDDAAAMKGAGKGQCPLCHGFKAGELSERAPNLAGIPTRAGARIKADVYKTQVTGVKEACSGCGRATTAIEYIAESHSCPTCFVVPGFGVKGSNDKESPMPVIHKAPIELSIDELIAVDTWLFAREGATPPSPKDIRAAYEKFIPEADRPKPGKTEEAGAGAPKGPVILSGADKPQDIVVKMGCIACHKIPTTAGKFGAVGPVLMEGTNAKKRISSPEYQARVKAGKARAMTPKEYIMESITDPNAFIVSGFAQKANPGESLMPKDFANKMTYSAISNLADFLLSLDAAAAKKDGMLPAGG
ncbi:MAG: nitric oxide reductase [Nitrospirae bacterium]|nr:nitric oxide reductase [Nitrospirota bacterium]